MRFLCFPYHPDWPWGSHSFLFCGYWGSSQGSSSQGVMLTTHFHLCAAVKNVHLLPLYAFMACPGTALSLLLTYILPITNTCSLIGAVFVQILVSRQLFNADFIFIMTQCTCRTTLKILRSYQAYLCYLGEMCVIACIDAVP